MNSDPLDNIRLNVGDFENFLFHEAELLDGGHYDRWLALFSSSAWYWVPIHPDQDSPHDMVSIIYDDRRLMETRVRRLSNENIHAQSPPSRTSRIIGNVVIMETDGENWNEDCEFIISSRFQMVEYRNEQQRIFAGRQLHGLIQEGDTFKICWKRVDLVNCEGMMEGIVVPF